MNTSSLEDKSNSADNKIVDDDIPKKHTLL